MTTPTPPKEDITTPTPPPWTTVPFWLTILTYALPVITLVFHKDFSGNAQGLANLAAAISTAAYMAYAAVERFMHHQKVMALFQSEHAN